MIKLNLQTFGGRGGGSRMVPRSSAMSSGPVGGFTRADSSTQGAHRDAVNTLNSPDYADGTYDISTMTPVDYDSGYQVTFSQIGDSYSDAEYADKVNEFLSVSSDGKTFAGKFEGTPEISFHCADRATAVRLAKKYNQISIWDWGACDEIKTGGTGRRQ